MGYLKLILYSTVTLASFPKPEAPPELHPKVKTQAHTTFYEKKITKCIWYENNPKKLCDHEFRIGLTN